MRSNPVDIGAVGVGVGAGVGMEVTDDNLGEDSGEFESGPFS